MDKFILRGDLYYADLNPVVGSEQGGIRPVLIAQATTGCAGERGIALAMRMMKKLLLI